MRSIFEQLILTSAVISVREFKGSKKYEVRATEKDVSDLIAKFDENGDGKITTLNFAHGRTEARTSTTATHLRRCFAQRNA